LDKNTITQTIRRSQLNAQKNFYDSNWGVYFSSTTIALFKGDSYQNRDTSFDQTVTLTGGLKVEEENNIVFNKTTGILDADTQINFKDNVNNDVRLHVNTFGVLRYE
jgi:hypothetical protein